MLCTTTSATTDRLLRLNEVCELTALKKTTVYKRIRMRQFPQQTQIGAPGAQRGTARWTLSAVSDWIEAQKSGQSWAYADSAKTTFQFRSMSANTTLGNEVAL